MPGPRAHRVRVRALVLIDCLSLRLQPRATLATKDTQGIVPLHGMIPGPEGIIETGANGRLYCPLINVALCVTLAFALPPAL